MGTLVVVVMFTMVIDDEFTLAFELASSAAAAVGAVDVVGVGISEEDDSILSSASVDVVVSAVVVAGGSSLATGASARGVEHSIDSSGVVG